MKVIFLKNVANIAKKNTVQEVKNGYARNFLIPNKLAKIATFQDLKELEAIRKIEQAEKEKDIKNKKDIIKKISGKEFVLKFNVGKEGQLFESVKASKIIQAIQEQGFDVQEDQIKIDKTIKSLGKFSISIDFGDDLKTEIVVVITN